MARYPRIREQHIALFGESGSGKTVLVSSFYGQSQEKRYANELWDLVADDTGLGNRLYKNYVGMRDYATVPSPTEFKSTTHYFSVKIKGGNEVRSARKRPFDVLRLAWHDYPGDWFEESPRTGEEANRQIDTFRSLLRSDVALLLVDGQQLLDQKGEEERYLKSLFTNFRQGLLRLKDELLEDGSRLEEFPRIWVIALSKADLFPEWDVGAFRDLIVWKINDHIEQLRETLSELIVAPEAMSLGEDFMLLSSARFKPATDDPESAAIDVTERVGLDLILPVASILPLERRVQWEARMTIPRKVAESMADGAETLAKALVGDRLSKLTTTLGTIPRVGPLAKMVAVPALQQAAQMTASQIRKVNEEAQASHDYLTAALTQFRLDLEAGDADGRLIRSK